jgi:hypothetical protein
MPTVSLACKISGLKTQLVPWVSRWVRTSSRASSMVGVGRPGEYMYVLCDQPCSLETGMFTSGVIPKDVKTFNQNSQIGA